LSRPAEAEPVKLTVSLFSPDQQLLADVIRVLAGHFGRPDFVSEHLRFDYTNYYEEEMGPGLFRRIVTFEQLVRPETLPDIKRITNGIEYLHTVEGGRRINIDPGYINRCHLILATGKPYSHRPYLRDWIYADVTLVYHDGSYHSLEWTYPDYAGPELKELLNRIREKYLLQLKNREKQI
jgi:hypothetical protein